MTFFHHRNRNKNNFITRKKISYRTFNVPDLYFKVLRVVSKTRKVLLNAITVHKETIIIITADLMDSAGHLKPTGKNKCSIFYKNLNIIPLVTLSTLFFSHIRSHKYLNLIFYISFLRGELISASCIFKKFTYVTTPGVSKIRSGG